MNWQHEAQAIPSDTQSRKGRQSSLVLVSRCRAVVGIANGVPSIESCKQTLSAPKKRKPARVLISPAAVSAQEWLSNTLNDLDKECERNEQDGLLAPPTPNPGPSPLLRDGANTPRAAPENRGFVARI